MGFSSSVFWPYQNSSSPSTYDVDENYDYNCNYDYNYNYNYNSNCTSSSSSSSSPSVDCTLSLATPSTRLTTAIHETTKQPHRNRVSSFCWDLLQSTPSAKPHRKPTPSAASDPPLARRCANCDTTSTPLWRNGPRGPKSLCNACGIRFKKEERRAAAATTTAAQNGATAAMIDSAAAHNGYYNTGSWANQGAAPHKMQCYGGGPNEMRFMEDGTDSSSGIQFISWLAHDRPSGLVHDFIR